MAIKVTPFDPNTVSYAGAGLGVMTLKRFKILERLAVLQFEAVSSGIFGFEGATIGESEPTLNTIPIGILPGDVKALHFFFSPASDSTGPIVSGEPKIGLEWHPIGGGDPVVLVSLTTVTSQGISQDLNGVELNGPGAFVLKASGLTGDSFTGIAMVHFVRTSV